MLFQLMFLIPLYFEVTHNASPGEAGAYMVPAVLGNTIGGIVTAGYLKRYGRTKYPIILSTIFSGLCYASILVLWNEGGTPVWKSFLIFPGGFAIGLAHSALFVALAAGVGEENMAIAGSGQYLCGTVGSVAGVCAASAVFKSGLNSALWREFENSHIPNSSEVCNSYFVLGNLANFCHRSSERPFLILRMSKDSLARSGTLS